MSGNSLKWFATHVDRDIVTIYGEGKPRLYIKDTMSYKVIDGCHYDKDINKLTVRDKCGIQYVLDNEPDQEWFKSSVHADWQKFDEQFGAWYMEDRSDYEPWSYDSIKSLAIELKLHEEANIIKFYGKRYKA
jgi:hypothetical protein